MKLLGDILTGKCFYAGMTRDKLTISLFDCHEAAELSIARQPGMHNKTFRCGANVVKGIASH